MTGLRRRGFLLGGLLILWPLRAGALSVYVAENGQVIGPFDEAALGARIGSRAQAAKTQVWMQGMADWAPATEVPALAALIAGLPQEPLFDAARYVIGSWASDDHLIQADMAAVMGRSRLDFAADGTVGGSLYGVRTSVYSRPGQRPGELVVVDDSVEINNRMTGKYTVATDADGFIVIRMTGKLTNLSKGSKGQTEDWKQSLELRRVGPDHMRTRYGINYFRTPG